MAAWDGTPQSRPAKPGDAEFLFEMFRCAREPRLVQAGLAPERVETLLHSQYAGRCMSYAEQYAKAEHAVLLDGAERVGSAVTARTGSAVVVVDLVIDPARRGRGLGGAWLRGRLAEAARTGMPVQLHVETHNVDARRLYERLGFVATAQTPTHIAMECDPQSGPRSQDRATRGR